MQTKDLTSVLQTIGAGLVISGFALAPLLVLPISDQPFTDTKVLIPIVLVLLFLTLFTIKSWSQKVISILISPLTIPLLILGSAAVASTFLSSNYPVEHLLGLGGVLISTVVFVLFGSSVVDKDKLEAWLPPALSVIGIVLSISTILQIFGFGPSYLFNLVYPVSFPSNALFNLAGSSIIAAEVLIVLLVGLASSFIVGKRTSLLEQIGVVIMVGGLLLSGWSMLPGKIAQPTLLPYTASWSIGVDTLKSPKTALIGFGPEGFINAFLLYKPNWINNTDMWNIQFSQGSNAPFTFLITLGLAGLLAWLLIAYTLIRQTKLVTKRGRAVHNMLLATLIIQLLLPVTNVLLVIQALLLMTWIVFESGRFSHLEIYGLTIRSIKNQMVAHPLTNNQKMVTYVFTAVMTLAIASVTYGVGRAYAAHIYTVKSIAAAQDNNAVAVYNNQQRSVALNPFLDETRRRYSSTNLIIATALAQKADLTEEENQQFSQLIQQSIRESRAATILDPTDSNNWTSLAQTYRALIDIADSADQWAVDSYISAIQTNPQNPVLRIELGGVFFKAKAYPRAAQFFQQAIDLKPDYANAYYNLANAYREGGQLEDAKASYQDTLRLIPADSENYFTAAAELQFVEELLKQKTPETTEDEELPPAPESGNDILNATDAQLESPLDTVGQPNTEPLNLENVETSNLN